MRTSACLVLAGLVAACGGAPPDPATTAAVAGAGGEQVVARVNGEVVTLPEVERLSAAAGLTPEIALARLVEERLLAQHAEARGYGQLHSVRIEVERARVRALLEQAVEAGTGPETVSKEAVERRFYRDLAKLTPRIRPPARYIDFLTGDDTFPPGGPRLEDYEDLLREQLSVEARRSKLNALLRELRDHTRVEYDEPAIEKALSDQGAAGTGT